ncbi:MAG: CDP-paratose 2-epimerase [Proteobacteria bacterium]|nr:CDP-paratose 2-epimerase [Pseudomonadota bacterium]
MRIHEFRTELWLPLPPAEVFPFFSDIGNLDAITPPWLHFHIVTPSPVVVTEGAMIDYRLRLHGFPLRWRTRINVWRPPHRFVDEQVRGPYRQWIHEHTFEAHEGGTLARDLVRYAVPMDWLVHRWLVRPDIERIFQYRTEVLRKHFTAVAKHQP